MPRDNWHRARLTMVTLPVRKRLCLFVWSLVRFLLYKPLLHASNYFTCSDHNMEMIMCAWELSDQIETNLPNAQATCCRWHLYKRLDERWCRFQGWLASKTPWLVMDPWWFSGDFPNCDLWAVLLGLDSKNLQQKDIQQTQKTDEVSRFLMNFVNNITNTIGGFLSDTTIYDPGNRKT